MTSGVAIEDAKAVTVRPAEPGDADAVWAILEPILRLGETYALPRDWSREQALAYWMAPDHRVLVAEFEGVVLGTCYLCANGLGGGGHIVNAAFATQPQASGRGIARALVEAAFAEARALGFAAMQFNRVVASNTRAVKLWTDFGFREIGRIPKAFDHPRLGLVDALVMHRFL